MTAPSAKKKRNASKTANECNFNPLPWEYVMTRSKTSIYCEHKVVYATANSIPGTKLEQFNVYDQVEHKEAKSIDLQC
jgi:hypothetical protein